MPAKISTLNDINALTQTERRVLEFFAYLDTSGGSRRADVLRSQLKISTTLYNAIVKNLTERGALIKGYYSQFSCNSEIRVAVLTNMALRHPDDANYLIDYVKEAPVYYVDKSINVFYDCLRYSLGILDARPSAVLSDEYLGAVINSYRLTCFSKLIAFFPTDQATEAIGDLLSDFISCDTTVTEEILSNITVDGNKLMKINVEDMKRIYTYCLDGSFNPPKSAEGRPYANVLLGIHSANRGAYAEAFDYFNAAFKVLNRDRDVKNVFRSFVASYYFITTLVHIGTEAAITKLKQYLKKKDIFYAWNQYVSVAIAVAFTSTDRKPSHNCLSNAIKVKLDGVPMKNINIMGEMAAKYFEVALTALSSSWTADRSNFPKFRIFRHEASAYLQLSDEERAALTALYGSAPMLTSIHRKQQWEWVIEDVVRNIDSAATPNATSRVAQSRLIYLIEGNYVVPYTQSWLKSGRWGAPKTVTRKRVEEMDLPMPEECDRKYCTLVRDINRNSFYVSWPTVEAALPILKDSGKVYCHDNLYNEKPIDIEIEEVYLKIEKSKDGSFTVSANVDAQDLQRSSRVYILKSGKGNLYTFIHVKPENRFILDRLLAQKSFPAAAEEQVKMLLTRMEEVVEVRSPLIDSKAIPTVKGSTFICARVAPAAAMTYKVDFEVHPHPQGTVYVFPGEGKAVIYEMIDGKNVRVKRNLKEETAAYKSLIDDLGSIDTDNSENGYSFLLSVDDVLDLMDYASSHPDTMAVEWVEGKGLSLKRPAASAWNIGLKANNEWFEIEGDVRVSEDSVMSMSQILDLIGQSRGRYVRLNDTDYMEISSKLRRQLERIESLSTKHRNKMVISPINAALIDDKTLDGELKVAFDQKLLALRQRIKDSNNYDAPVPSTLQAQLRPYQVDGYQWMARLASWGAGACLADDMGLGKTVETIAFLLLKAADGPALVVAPASVVPNWINELTRFAPTLTPYVLNKAADRAQLIKDAGPHDVILSTYGILSTEEENLAKKKWTTICLDEAHIIKNKGTKMSQAAMSLSADNRVILTGTPIQNHLGELWNLFRFINPGLLGSDEAFRHKFVLPIQEGDKDRQRALQRIIKPFMLRRTKNEVVDDLPEKTEIVLPVELSDSEMAMYEAMRIKAANVISESDKVDVNTLAEITRLRRAACSMQLVDDKWTGPQSKVQALLDLVDDFRGAGNRMLVFSQFTSFLAIVREALDKARVKYLYLDGSTSMKEREKMVKEFKTGDVPIFIISLKAGGLGLNLPEANYVVHLDPWWNPAIEQQATDRAYRIGQKRNVTVYHLVAKNTIEEKIRRLHRSKRDLSDSLLEGTDMASKLDMKEILELVNA